MQPPARAVTALADEWGGRPQSTAIGHPERLPAASPARGSRVPRAAPGGAAPGDAVLGRGALGVLGFEIFKRFTEEAGRADGGVANRLKV